MQQPKKKNRVKISKNPLSFRPRAKSIRVVVDGEDPTKGSVGVTVCEIPKGLLKDLKDDIEGASDELTRNVEEEAAVRLRVMTEIKAATEQGVSGDELVALKLRVKSSAAEELRELKNARRQLRSEQSAAQLAIIRWGVCDHDPDCFDLTDELEADDDQVDEIEGDDRPAENPFPFERGSENYDGVNYLVAGSSVIEAYKSIGSSFLDALYFAIIAWQESRYNPPEKVWEETKRINEVTRRAIAKRVKAQLEAAGVSEDDPEARALLAELEGSAGDNPLTEGQPGSTS